MRRSRLSTTAWVIISIRSGPTQQPSWRRTCETEIDAINDALRFDIGDFAVPPVPAVPEPIVVEDHPFKDHPCH